MIRKFPSPAAFGYIQTMLVNVPAWDARGVLPPCDPLNPVAAERSPFRVSLEEFALDFALNSERVQILTGFLQYREALHAAGLVSGFQWINGSFCEDIEMIEHRPPGDIDVVTFYVMPSGFDQASLKASNPPLFPVNRAEQHALKAKYSVDAYTKDLDPDPSSLQGLIDTSVYWSSVWSHRRDMTWKGYLQIDLSPSEDNATRAALLNITPPMPYMAATTPGGP